MFFITLEHVKAGKAIFKPPFVVALDDDKIEVDLNDVKAELDRLQSVIAERDLMIIELSGDLHEKI